MASPVSGSSDDSQWSLPGPVAPGDLAFQKKLQDSQWWPAERLLDHQLRRLTELAVHAQRTVPFHRRRFETADFDPSQPFTLDQWRQLPVLTREEIQASGTELLSTAVPAAHGELLASESSGSTGMPVTVFGTVFDAWVSKAITLRHFLWHPHDFAAKYVSIRRVSGKHADYPAGSMEPRWGDSATFPFATGPAALLSIGASIAQQAEWLARQDPDYLLTYPSNLLFLAAYCREHGIALPHLEHAATLGEVLKTETRTACRQAWDTPVIDTYSAQEVGAIAHQCPEHEHYHVQAEAVMVEVVDDRGSACVQGQVGQVVVTPLFNYAMPLLRYQLGDYAEVGEPCACGRGLPVLKRVLGRERNSLLITPTGERYWPAFGTRKLAQIAPITQHQFVQKELDWIEARLVVRRPLTAADEDRLRAHVLGGLPWPFRLSFRYCDEIPRNAGGKFENFISEVSA
jgi:phenylacetate-CoA ligase